MLSTDIGKEGFGDGCGRMYSEMEGGCEVSQGKYCKKQNTDPEFRAEVRMTDKG